eukprot:351897-Chlamydomonas_euryale.AAC.10
MVPGAPRRFAGKSPAPGLPSAPQLLPHSLPHRQVVKQPSPRSNGDVLENQPRKDENDGEVCDFRGPRTHFAPVASAQWKLTLIHISQRSVDVGLAIPRPSGRHIVPPTRLGSDRAPA